MAEILDKDYGPTFEESDMPTDLPKRVQFNQIPRKLESSPTKEYGLYDNMKAAFTASRFGVLFSNYSEDEAEILSGVDISGIGAEGFDKWDAFDKAGYSSEQSEYYDRNVNSYSDFISFKNKFEKISQAKKIMSESGLTGGVASFLSETVGDPLFLATLPIGFAGQGPRLAKFAMVGAASSAPSEALAISVDPTRTTKDAIVNIAASTVLSGLLGGAIDSFNYLGKKGLTSSGADLNAMGDRFIQESSIPKDIDPSQLLKQKFSGASVGAMASPKLDYSPAGSKVGQLAAKAFAFISPSNRSAKYTQPESQALNALVAGNPLYITKSAMEGKALGETIPDIIQKYVGDFTRVSDETRIALKSHAKLTKQSHEAVEQKYYSIAMNEKISTEDLLIMSKEGSEDSVIFARAYEQRKLAEKAATDLEAAGVEGFNRRKSYAHQFQFNKMKASADYEGLRNALIERYSSLKKEMMAKYGKEISNLEEFSKRLDDEKSEFVNRLDKKGRTYDEVVAGVEEEIDLLKRLATATDEDFMTWVDTDLTNIIHGRSESYSYLGFGRAKEVPGFFLPRTIDPIKFQPWAETDFQKLNGSYGRQASAKLAFTKLLGDNTGKKAIEDYEKVMNERISQARTAKNSKMAEKLAKEKNDLVSDVTQLLRQHDGTYASEFYAANPTIASTIELASNAISFSALGNAVLGSVSEMAAVMLHHGAKSVMPSYGKALKKIATDSEFRNLAVKDLQATGRAFELANNALIGSLSLEAGTNLGDASIRGFRGMEVVKKYYYRLNAQVYYDYFSRLVLGLTQQTVLAKNIKNLVSGKMAKRDIEQMASMGIDYNMAKKILPHIEKNITYDSNLALLNIGKWEDRGLAETVKTALIRDMRRTALSFRAGDLPIVSAHPAMRLLLKFKQWPLMATQNYMIPSLQRADATALAGAVTMAGFGSLAFMARELSAGRELPDDPSDILYAGIEMSGVGGITHELGVNYLANYLGIKGGGAGFVGYSSLLEQLVGPAARYVKNIDNASNMLPGGDEGDLGDLKYLWKLMPLNNHPFSKQIEAQLEE